MALQSDTTSFDVTAQMWSMGSESGGRFGGYLIVCFFFWTAGRFGGYLGWLDKYLSPVAFIVVAVVESSKNYTI